MKTYYCKKCKQSFGTRRGIRKHLRDEHWLRKKGQLIEKYYSIDENGNRMEYEGGGFKGKIK